MSNSEVGDWHAAGVAVEVLPTWLYMKCEFQTFQAPGAFTVERPRGIDLHK